MIDGQPIDEIRENLELQLDAFEEYYSECSHYWLRAGRVAPTFGLVGAVMGLMLALGLLEDPVLYGLAVSLVRSATVTGIMGAYAFFIPFWN